MSIEEQREAILAKVEEKLGFVPNVIKEMATSPVVVDVYLKGVEALSGGAFSPQEMQVINLAAATAEECNYCKAGHTAMAKMAGVEASELELIKAGKDPVNERLQALVCATRVIHDKRGKLSADDLKCAEGKGLTRGELYEIVAISATKMITTYINHIAGTKIDKEFADGGCCEETGAAASTGCCG